MKELYNKHKREIVVGVIVSLITAIIVKFGDWLIEIVPIASSSILEIVSNVLFSLAANHSDNLLLRIILLGSFSFLAGTLTISISAQLKLYKSSLSLEKKTKNFSDEELDDINKKTSSELLQKESENVEESIPDLIKRGKKIGRSAITSIILIVCTYIFITLFITTPMTLSNQFQQDILKIAPYVEESEIIQLKSDWVCMRSKADYNDIYERINIVKEEHELP